MHFHIVASTGRTATTYIAAALNRIDSVCACHESYVGALNERDPLLPLINLENRMAYQDHAKSNQVVATKRSTDILHSAAREVGADVLIDVAYYNATIGQDILELHRSSRMVGIIRDCESFVRSSTTLVGEDLLPVGWPEPTKPLSRREKFIQMGRIKPRPGTSAADLWENWTAVERNIWLWQETNILLREAQKLFEDRVILLDFDLLKSDSDAFWNSLGAHFRIESTRPDKHLSGFVNKKQHGYQVGPISSWTPAERAFAEEASKRIGYPLP